MKRPVLIISLLVLVILLIMVLSPREDVVIPESPITSRSDVSAPVTSDNRPTTAVNPDKELTALQLELSEALQSLPTLEEISDLKDEDVHHTPEIVISAGAKIGDLLTAAGDDPTRQEETAKFFLSCAEDEDVVASVRALCWKSLTRKIPEWKVFLPISEAKVPREIQTLSERAD